MYTENNTLTPKKKKAKNIEFSSRQPFRRMEQKKIKQTKRKPENRLKT
jgi:hypothetical protein